MSTPSGVHVQTPFDKVQAPIIITNCFYCDNPLLLSFLYAALYLYEPPHERCLQTEPNRLPRLVSWCAPSRAWHFEYDRSSGAHHRLSRRQHTAALVHDILIDFHRLIHSLRVRLAHLCAVFPFCFAHYLLSCPRRPPQNRPSTALACTKRTGHQHFAQHGRALVLLKTRAATVKWQARPHNDR
jgi:hypothetical protein